MGNFKSAETGDFSLGNHKHQGDLVIREEIQRKLWPNDTIVDFEHGINNAIKTLRQALCDSADSPRFIETIPRRGYRFRAAVEPIQPEQSATQLTGQVRDDDPRSDLRENASSLIGRRVSRYRVLRILGGGGMGIVFEAEDLKLGRRVALKFLPEELASEPAALQRFEREARAASSLNHPNICIIHDIEEYQDQPVLVMELLEGQTLRDRLTATTSKGMPIDELLDVGVQISAGLQAAHEKGIIHRDIKPANLFITHTGQVKILDFGLAKLVNAAKESGTDCVQVIAARAGVPGNVLEGTVSRVGFAMGTAGYMSPEQVSGGVIDARSDLFSFGLVLYEMAGGQRAFVGGTAAMVQEAIAHAAPVPLKELRSTLSPRLAAVIMKALEKDPNQRYQSAAEMNGVTCPPSLVQR